MTSFPRLSRILVTSDDGIDSEGMARLVDSAKPFAEEVWIVAPATNQSGISQATTLQAPISLSQRDDRVWAVNGTPSDCVIIAKDFLMETDPPALVLSGINAGENLGEEAGLSGCVGAALTGLMLGIPSMAFSLDYPEDGELLWDTASALTTKLLTYFLSEGWQKNTCLSVNIPSVPVPEIKSFCWTRPMEKYIRSIEVIPTRGPRGCQAVWLSPQRERLAAESQGTDCAAIVHKKVSVSALTLDRSVEILKPSVRFDSIELSDNE